MERSKETVRQYERLSDDESSSALTVTGVDDVPPFAPFRGPVPAQRWIPMLNGIIFVGSLVCLVLSISMWQLQGTCTERQALRMTTAYSEFAIPTWRFGQLP